VKKLRVGAALAGVSAITLMTAAIPAGADTVPGKIVDPTDAEKKVGAGLQVLVEKDGKKQPFHADLFVLQVGDKRLRTYCVDILTDIQKDAKYVEVPWDKHPNPASSFTKNAAKINWVLHNGYPEVAPASLAAKVGGTFDKGLTEEESVTATQAAVWHFSDDTNIDRDNPVPDAPDSKADVLAVYDYLIGKKNEGIEAPKPELNLTPKTLPGKPGTLIGPFVVTTTANGIKVLADLPAGVQLTDKDGKELAKADVAMKIQQLDKYEFYVKVPADAKDGKVNFTVSGDTPLSLGRLFVSSETYADNKKQKPSYSQSMILAKTDKMPLEAKGEAGWNSAGAVPPTTDTTPVPQPKAATAQLASTGASIVTPIVIGVVLVGTGVGALLLQRRRRRV
jgi:TQXA domain-containing protein